jgi:hypothetical protein
MSRHREHIYRQPPEQGEMEDPTIPDNNHRVRKKQTKRTYDGGLLAGLCETVRKTLVLCGDFASQQRAITAYTFLVFCIIVKNNQVRQSRICTFL